MIASVIVLVALFLFLLLFPILDAKKREKKRKVARAQQATAHASQRLGVTIYPRKKDTTE